MAKQILIILQIVLLANVLLAQSCNRQNCARCSSCEVRRVSPVPCYNTNDLIVLLDGSGSIGSGNFVTAKNFVNKLAGAYTAQSGSRFGFITFSDTASTVVSLTNTLSSSALSSAILGASYTSVNTYTNLGIDAAVAEFASSPRSVPLNLVVITDGLSTNPSATVTSATAAAGNSINTYSVGVGSGVNQSELNAIAGGNSTRVYNAASFDELVNLLNPLSRAVCKN